MRALAVALFVITVWVLAVTTDPVAATGAGIGLEARPKRRGSAGAIRKRRTDAAAAAASTHGSLHPLPGPAGLIQIGESSAESGVPAPAPSLSTVLTETDADLSLEVASDPVRTSTIDIDQSMIKPGEVLESLELPVEEQSQWITNITVISRRDPLDCPFGFTCLPVELRGDAGLPRSLVLAYERSYEGKPVTSLSVTTADGGCPAGSHVETAFTRLISNSEWTHLQSGADKGMTEKLLSGGKYSRTLCVAREKGKRPITHIEVVALPPLPKSAPAHKPAQPKTLSGTYRSLRLFQLNTGAAIDVVWRIRPKLHNRNLRRSLAYDRWAHTAGHFRVETLPSAAFSPAHIRRRTEGIILFGGKSIKPVVGDIRYHNDVQAIARTYSVVPTEPEDEYALPDTEWSSPKWGKSHHSYTWRVTNIAGTPPAPREGHTMTAVPVSGKRSTAPLPTTAAADEDGCDVSEWYSAAPPKGMKSGSRCSTHRVAERNWYVVFGGYDSSRSRSSEENSGRGGAARYFDDVNLLHIDHSSDPDGVVHGRWEQIDVTDSPEPRTIRYPNVIPPGEITPPPDTPAREPDTELISTPLARARHTAEYVGGGFIVIFGGINTQNFSSRSIIDNARDPIYLNDLAFLNVSSLQNPRPRTTALPSINWDYVETRGTAPSPRAGHSSALLRLARADYKPGRDTEPDRTYMAVYGGVNNRDGLLSDLHILRIETKLAAAETCLIDPIMCNGTLCCTNTTRCFNSTQPGVEPNTLECVNRVECCTNTKLTADEPAHCTRNVTACIGDVCCSMTSAGLIALVDGAGASAPAVGAGSGAGDAASKPAAPPPPAGGSSGGSTSGTGTGGAVNCAELASVDGARAMWNEWGANAACVKPIVWSTPVASCCDAAPPSSAPGATGVASDITPFDYYQSNRQSAQCCTCLNTKSCGPQSAVQCCTDGVCECKTSDKLTSFGDVACNANACALRYCNDTRIEWLNQYWFTNATLRNSSFCPPPVVTLRYVEWLHFGDRMANGPQSRAYHTAVSMLNHVRAATNSLLVVGGVHRVFESLVWGDGQTRYRLQPIAAAHRLYCVENVDALTPQYIARSVAINGARVSDSIAPPITCKWDLMDLDLRDDLKSKGERDMPSPKRVDPVYSAEPDKSKFELSSISKAPEDLWHLRRPSPEVARILGLSESDLRRFDEQSGTHRNRPFNSDRRSFTASVMIDHTLMVVGGVSNPWNDVCPAVDAERVLAVGWPGFDRSLQVPIPQPALAQTIDDAETSSYWQPQRKRYKA